MTDLLVMRHAKSDHSAACASDHERPLAERGVAAARQIGRFLSTSGTAPALALVSSALRARTTCELAAEAGAWECKLLVDERLYLASAGEVAAIVAEHVRGLDGALLVVGHEPTSSELVALLSGGGRVRMPTAAVACLRLGDADPLLAGGAELRWLVTPKLLATPA